MTANQGRTHLNPQILEEATEWLIELGEGDADATVRQRFDSWLRASPEHVRAYLEILPIWEDGALQPPGAAQVPADLIQWARDTASVVTLDAARSGAKTAVAHRAEPPRDPFKAAPPPARWRPSRRHGLVASVALLIIAAGALLWLARDPVYVTDVGEQRSVSLSDGSIIDLNARSRVRVHYGHEQRTVELLEGQGVFRVAKDPARPFVVESGGTRVRAVGTQFDVNRRASGTTVTVLEGRVSVATASGADEKAAPEPVFLSRGEQVTIDSRVSSASPSVADSPAAPIVPKAANLSSATAWKQRRLVFEAATLEEVVEEFNRYNRQQLVIHSRALASFPISAAFSSTDPASLVRFLEAQPGIRIIAAADEIQIAAAN